MPFDCIQSDEYQAVTLNGMEIQDDLPHEKWTVETDRCVSGLKA